MHICLGHLTVLFGFLSTPSENWQAECSQCLNGFKQATTSWSSPHSLQFKHNRKCNKMNEKERETKVAGGGLKISNISPPSQQVKEGRQLDHSH